MAKICVVFKTERQTKNTIRYAEMSHSLLDAEKVVGSLYVQKEALDEAFSGVIPDQLKVTIESAE